MTTSFPLEVLGHLIARELAAVRKQLLAYGDERDIWLTPSGVSNSAGTLALHVVGNLRHFLGAVLGGTGYVRRRDAEFSARDMSLHELLEEIDAAQRDVRHALAQVSEDALQARFPASLGGLNVETKEFLLHLLSHLAYHLGQIDYHRRVVTGNTGGVGAVDVAELRTATPAT
jgi:uncharacterized damage-inducible protein DinB